MPFSPTKPRSMADWIGERGGIYQPSAWCGIPDAAGRPLSIPSPFCTRASVWPHPASLADTLFQGFFFDFRIVRIQEQAQLRFIQVLRVFHAGRRFDFVGIVQQHAQIADTAHAGFRADGRLAHFDTRIAERAFFGFAAGPVVVDFFVWAAGYAHTPAAAFVLVNQHNTVVFAFINAAGRAGGHAGRVQTVFTQAGQIHHEGLLECGVHFFLNAFEQHVFATFFKFAGQVVFPVRTPFHFVHFFAGNHGNGTRGGWRFHFWVRFAGARNRR